MFRPIIQFLRGRANDQVEEFADRNGLTILKQQIRECASAHAAAQKAVAVAIAQNKQEARQHEEISARIADLESRTMAAMEQGKDDLAREAASSIAILEAERAASEKALKQFDTEIARLRRIVEDAKLRLRALQRGERLATATSRTHTLRNTGTEGAMASLNEAEQTLSRLRQRQQEIDDTAAVIEEMDRTGTPEAVAEKLAQAGCGAPIKEAADDVLARLQKKMDRKQGGKKKAA